MSDWKTRTIAVTAALVVLVSLPALGGFAGFGHGKGAAGQTGWTWG